MSFDLREIVAVLFIALCLHGCNLEPIHKKKETSNYFCTIDIEQPKSNLIFYELNFYNQLNLKFCKNKSYPKSLFLKWTITKSSTGLITAKNAAVSRYEVVLKITFQLINNKSSDIIYTDTIKSKAAHNVLEDELFSTLTAERNAEILATKDLVTQMFYRIYLFNENQ